MHKWEELVRKVVPYVPGEQPRETDLVKLNTNENPYPPSPAVKKAIAEAKSDELRLYPDPMAVRLRDAAASVYGISREEVFAGVGSDDVLAMSFLTFFGAPQDGSERLPVLFPDITYSFYDVWADLFRIPYRAQPLDEDFRIKKEDYLIPNGGIVIANPNAPTGIFEDPAVIEEIVAGNPDSVVIVDEAYVDFGAQSVLPLIRKYSNLLVVQTCSKSRSLAGLRIGFAFGDPLLIKYLFDVRNSFNSYTLSRTAIEAGTAALLDADYFEKTRGEIIKTREESRKRFEALGFHCLPSCTNFLFVTHPRIDAETIMKELRAEKIFVRYFKKPRIDQYLRITIGTKEEMDRLFAVLTRLTKTYLPEK